MGKPTGFMEWPRVPRPSGRSSERVGDSREFVLPLAPDEAKRQAGRCMDCGVPFCHQGCPLGNLIPDFNDAVYRGRWKAAFHALHLDQQLPRVHRAGCAPRRARPRACWRSTRTPVAIEQMEKEIIERAFAEGWVRRSLRRGARASAWRWWARGRRGSRRRRSSTRRATRSRCTSATTRSAGCCATAFPTSSWRSAVLERRLKLLEAEGIEFRTGVDVGGALGFAALREQHDAVVLAMGARRARELEVPGRELSRRGAGDGVPGAAEPAGGGARRRASRGWTRRASGC